MLRYLKNQKSENDRNKRRRLRRQVTHKKLQVGSPCNKSHVSSTTFSSDLISLSSTTLAVVRSNTGLRSS